MPELPEVETIVRDLRSLLCGREIVTVGRGRRRLRFAWKLAWNARVAGGRVMSISRRGKWLLFALDDGGQLLGHLGMTGHMCVVPAGDRREQHTHLIFKF